MVMLVIRKESIPLASIDLMKGVPSIPLHLTQAHLSMDPLALVNIIVAVSMEVLAARARKEVPLQAHPTSIAAVQAVSIKMVAVALVANIGKAIPQAQVIPNHTVLVPARTRIDTGREKSTSPAVALEISTNQVVALETSINPAVALVTNTDQVVALETSTSPAVAVPVTSISRVAVLVTNINQAVAAQVINTNLAAVQETNISQAAALVTSTGPHRPANIKNPLNQSTEKSKEKIRKIEK